MKYRFLSMWSALVIVLGAVILYGFREPLIKRGIDLFLMPTLQEQLGAEVTIGDVSTDLYSRLSFTDIAVLSPDDSEQTHFSLVLQRADYHFRLYTLLNGFASFLEQSRFVVSGGKLNFTLIDNEEKDSSFTLPDELPYPKELFLPEMVVQEIDINIASQDRFVSLERLSGTVRRKQATSHEYSLQLQTTLFTLADKNKNERLWSGPISLDAGFSDEGVSIFALQCNGETILEQAQLGRRENQSGLLGRGKLHLLGIHTDFSTTLQKNTVSVRAEAKMQKNHALASLATGWQMSPPEIFNAEIDAHLDLSHPELSQGRLVAEMEDAVINGMAINKFFIDGTMADGICRLQQLDVQSTGNHLLLTDASLQLTSLLQDNILEALRQASAAFQISLTDIPALTWLAGDYLPVEKAPIHTLNLTGRLDRGSLNTVKGSLTIDTNQLTIGTLTLTLPKETNNWEHAAVTFSANLSISDPAIISSYFNLEETGGTLQGNIALSGMVSKPSGLFDVNGSQLHYGEITLDTLQLDGRLDESGTIQAKLQIRSPDNGLGELSAEVEAFPHEKRLLCKQLRLDNPHGKGEAAMELQLTEQGLNATLHSLYLSRQDIDMRLTKPARILLHADSLTLAQPFELTGDAGTIKLEGTVGSKANNLTITGSGLTSGRWLEGLVKENIAFSGVDLLAGIRGTVDQPNLTLAVRADKLSSSGSPLVFYGEIDADYTKSGLQIKKCALHDTNSSSSLRLEGFLPLIVHKKIELLPTPISLTADIDLPDAKFVTVFFPDYLEAGASIKAEAKLQGTWTQPDGRISLLADGLRPSALMDWLPPDPFSLQCAATLSAGELKLTNLSAASPGLNLDLAGDWTFTDTLHKILSDGENIPAGNLNIKGDLVANDIGPLAQQLSAFHSMGGKLEAQLSATGTLDNPLLEADLHISQGMLRFDADFPVLRDIDIKAKLNPDNLHLIDAIGQLGGSPFRLNGDLYFAKGEELRLALALDGENILLHRDDVIRLRADSKLSLEGPISLLTLAGKLTVKDSMYAKDVSLLNFTEGKAPQNNGQQGVRLFTILDKPFSDMKINVAIATGEPFLIRNNIARGSLRPDLWLTGTGRFPELRGVVYLDPTRVSLPAGTLTLESGTVRFPVNNPEFPELDINGSSKMMGYDVDVHIGGRYDEPVITLSSSPALTNEELLLLLLAGVRPKSDPKSASTMAGSNIALYLGKGLLASWFGEGGADPAESFLDRLDVDVGRAVTRQGDSTIEARLRVIEGVFKPNDTVYLKTEKDVYDDYNTGVRIVFRFR